MFLGEYRHQIDEKGRVRIPAKLKEELGETPFITKGTDGCLFVYSQTEAEKVFFNKFKDSDFSNPIKVKNLRLLMSSAVNAEEDKQGRILLPSGLIKHAKFNKNIVTIGALNHVEIWSEEVWSEYTEGAEINFNADDGE